MTRRPIPLVDPEDLRSADLILVRHARPRLKSGVPASEWQLERESFAASQALATEIADLLGGVGRRVTHLWSSTEPKAVETGVAMGETWGLGRPVEVDGLGEHRRGPMPLVDDVQWHESITRMFRRPDEVVLGLETANQAKVRFTAAIQEVVAAAGSGALSAVATHATVMTLLLAEANELEPVSLWGSLEMPDALVVDSRGFKLVGRASLGTA